MSGLTGGILEETGTCNAGSQEEEDGDVDDKGSELGDEDPQVV